VNFGDARGGNVVGQQLAAPNHGKADVRQSSLVSAAGGIANDNGKNIDRQMIMVGTRQSARDRKPSVPASQVENQRRRSSEQRSKIQDPRGDLLERRFGPFRRIEDFARNRDPEFPLCLARIRLIDCRHARTMCTKK
jgi:hypothetical protein